MALGPNLAYKSNQVFLKGAESYLKPMVNKKLVREGEVAIFEELIVGENTNYLTHCIYSPSSPATESPVFRTMGQPESVV